MGFQPLTLEGVDQKKQVRHLLIWVGDKGLEIYNTTTWAADDDKDKTEPVLNALENYTKPQSNQILSRYQLRCLKQGDMSLEEFVTKARLLVDDSGYPAAVNPSFASSSCTTKVTHNIIHKYM